jgi:hypothetical protein
MSDKGLFFHLIYSDYHHRRGISYLSNKVGCHHKSNDLTNIKAQGQNSSITNFVIYYKSTNIKRIMYDLDLQVAYKGLKIIE